MHLAAIRHHWKYAAAIAATLTIFGAMNLYDRMSPLYRGKELLESRWPGSIPVCVFWGFQGTSNGSVSSRHYLLLPASFSETALGVLVEDEEGRTTTGESSMGLWLLLAAAPTSYAGAKIRSWLNKIPQEAENKGGCL